MATTTGVDDELLLKIAEKTPENKFVKLALALKISVKDAQRYYKSNHVNGEISANGTWSMLCDWKENTKEEDQQTDLKHALEEAQLKGVADEFFGRKILANDIGRPNEDSRITSNQREILLQRGIRQRLERQKRGHAYDDIERETLIQMQDHLKQQYRDPKRFSDGIAQERSFQPRLYRRDGSGLENSRYDIFNQSSGGNIRRRILVSGNQPHRHTALSHILAYDWATENESSPISDQELVFELEGNKFARGQSIESAIKQQLLSGLDEVDEDKIKQILESIPNNVTILIDGVDWKHIGKYGDNIRNVLTGQALQEVTVMVTATPHSAKQLHRRTQGGYDCIHMESTITNTVPANLELPEQWIVLSHTSLDYLVSTMSSVVRDHLVTLYKDPERFMDGYAQERSFQPMLTRRDGSRLESSRYDIFDRLTRRILVSGNQPHEKVALLHILAYDWATENKSSPIWDQELVFELEANKFASGQSIESAIRQQLFSGLDAVDDHKIKQILEFIPNEVTVLIDGVDWKHTGKYGDNIKKVLTGQALQEVTVMVTTTLHSAKQLHQNSPDGYDCIHMENA